MNDDELIELLSRDLRPVKPLRVQAGLLALGLAAMTTALTSILLFGHDGVLLSPRASAFALISNAVFLATGVAAAISVLRMAQPQIGNRFNLWKAALAALLALLGGVAAMAVLAMPVFPQIMPHELLRRELVCIAIGLGLSLIPALVLAAWLRRGAATSPERAGLLAGLGAAGIAIAAFSLSCPYDDPSHHAFSHGVCVLLGAAAGRYGLSRLVRW